MASVDEEKRQQKIAMTLIQTVSPYGIALYADKQGACSAVARAEAKLFEKSTT